MHFPFNFVPAIISHYHDYSSRKRYAPFEIPQVQGVSHPCSLALAASSAGTHHLHEALATSSLNGSKVLYTRRS